MNIKDLGAKIRRLRKECGLTQEDLAGRSKIAHRALQRLESGEGNPTMSTVEALSKALGEPLLALTASDSGSPDARSRDIGFAASVLQTIQALRPARKQFVLALIFDDPDYLEIEHLRPAFQSIRKPL